MLGAITGGIKVLGQFFKIISFFLNMWKERDEERAAKKAEVGKEIIDAFKETDKKTQASRLNNAVGNINRLRGY